MVAWPWAEVASVAAWVEVASVAAAVHTSLAEVIGAHMATDMVVDTAEATVGATATVVMEATDMGRASWAV